MDRQLTIGRAARAVVDPENIEAFPAVEVVYEPYWRPLSSPTASADVYWLALMPLMSDIAGRFLKHIDDYLKAACPIDARPSSNEQPASRQLALFAEWESEEVPKDHLADIVLTDVVSDLAEVLRNVQPRSLSDLASAAKSLRRVLRKLGVAEDDPDHDAEVRHQLLTVADELRGRLSRQALILRTERRSCVLHGRGANISLEMRAGGRADSYRLTIEWSTPARTSIVPRLPGSEL